ncbi:MAG TPA: hypothetical protein VF748_14990 [Candidatus Acidoferrum sp.]
MRKALQLVALFAAAVLGASVGFGGGVPLVPSSPTFNEPSQIVSTLNAFVNQLNGNALGSGGYAAQPNGTVSLGSYCTASGATPQTCNANRGAVSFTGTTVAADAAVTVTITNSTITTASNCIGGIQNNPTAAASPFVSSITPTAGSLAVVLGNPGTTTGSVTLTVGFTCFN